MATRRMPQTQLVVMTDREGDLHELHDEVQIGPANLHTLNRAQHDWTLSLALTWRLSRSWTRSLRF
jgi:hypothetical protein